MTSVSDQFCGKVPKNVTAFPLIIIIIIWFITHANAFTK